MIQLTDAAIIINNEVVGVMPNSVSFTEGFGEHKVRAVSVGEGRVEQVFARDLESAFSMVKLSIPTTPENVRLARSWKANGNLNVVQIAGRTSEGVVNRTFARASLTANYEVPIGTETAMELEFQSDAAI